MDQQTVSLCMKDLAMITGSLRNIVSKSFGPKGGQTLIMSSTGQMAVTHDGASILSALHLSHPIAKLIVDSVRSFGTTCGDGCKTFIIYLHALISVIDRSFANLDFKSSDDLAYRSMVLKCLHEFTNNDLFIVCNEMQEFFNAQNCKEHKNGANFEDSLHDIILTCFNGFPAKVGSHLARNVANFTYAAETGHNANSHFLDILLPMLPNLPYENSCISDGLFLAGRFFGQQTSASSVKLIFMQCPIEGFVDTESTDAVAVSCTSRESFITYRAKVARDFLHCRKSLGVSLILTTHAVPSYIVQICNELNVDVLSCLDTKDLKFITYITEKLPVSSIYESFSDEENIVAVNSWEYVVLGGKHCVKIDFDKGYTRYRPKSMFLCAPTEGMCQQLKLLVKKSISVLDRCFSRPFRETVYSNKSTVCSELIVADVSTNPSLQAINKEHHDDAAYSNSTQFFQNNIIVAGVSTNPSLQATNSERHEDVPYSNSTSFTQNNIIVADVSTNPSLQATNNKCHEDVPYSNSTQFIQNNIIVADVSTNTSLQATNNERHEDVPYSNSTSFIQNNIIAGGGYFEHVLTHFLRCYNQKNNLPHKQFCCRIIMKMLEAVPLALSENHHPLQSRPGRNFLCRQQEMIDAVNSEVDTQTIRTSFENGGGGDVLSIKFEVLFAVINLVVKLLRIDAVVGVKRLVKDDTRGSQVEASDDVE